METLSAKRKIKIAIFLAEARHIEALEGSGIAGGEIPSQ
jgi:hypothetical protein